MSHVMFSVLIWCWHDTQTDTTQLRMVHVGTGEEVRLKNGSFLLQISRDEGSSVERCLIRHLSSGREAYVQSGSTLSEFVKSCLLTEDGSKTIDSGSTGE